MSITITNGPTYQIFPPDNPAPCSEARYRAAFEMQEEAEYRVLAKSGGEAFVDEYKQYKEARWANWLKWAHAMPPIAEVVRVSQPFVNSDGSGYGLIYLTTARGETITLFLNQRGHEYEVSGHSCGLKDATKVKVHDGGPDYAE